MRAAGGASPDLAPGGASPSDGSAAPLAAGPAAQPDAAIDALSLACGLNPDHRTFALDEPDLDALRTDERFRRLIRPSNDD